MKKILIPILIHILSVSTLNAQQIPAIQLANKIAIKMKDTLNLTPPQRNQVYHINMKIHNLKTDVRQQYSNADSIKKYLQKAENKRDSLFRNIMSEYKYQLYRQKKRNLITAN